MPEIKCFACTIIIGLVEEKKAYPVGDKKLCGHCLDNLQSRGKLYMGEKAGTNTKLYLMPTGDVVDQFGKIVKYEPVEV